MFFIPGRVSYGNEYVRGSYNIEGIHLFVFFGAIFLECLLVLYGSLFTCFQIKGVLSSMIFLFLAALVRWLSLVNLSPEKF